MRSKRACYAIITALLLWNATSATQTDAANIATQIAIQESQGGTEPLSAEQVHFFIVPMGDQIQITEHYLISNHDTKTYNGTVDPTTGIRTTLTFSLLQDAQGLTAHDDAPDRYLIEATTLHDTVPIPPGEAIAEIRFSYKLPHRTGQVIARTFPIPVEAVVLVVMDENLKLEGDMLHAMAPLDTAEIATNAYTSGPISKGELLQFKLVSQQDITQASPTTRIRNAQQEIGIGLLALAGAMLASYWLWQRPKQQPIPKDMRPLVSAIAALDAHFEAGEITEDAYQEKRKAYKQQLNALMHGQKTDD